MPGTTRTDIEALSLAAAGSAFCWLVLARSSFDFDAAWSDLVASTGADFGAAFSADWRAVAAALADGVLTAVFEGAGAATDGFAAGAA
jgi:hypothetical protein